MKPRLAVSVAILALWLAAVVFLATRHEVFRDEVRALSMATGPAHFWQIPEALRNEGHPVLWYLVLRGFHAVLGTPVALKIASIAVAFGAALLLFRFAPFPLWQKALLLFGALPVYEYSVMARNYGIGMLLLFAFAAAWPVRRERPLVPAILLVLLAQTSLHACVLAVVLAGFWIWEERGRRAVLLASVLVALGVACAIATCWPDPTTAVTPALRFSAGDWLRIAGENLVHPGRRFDELLLGAPALLRTALIWVLAAGLLVRPAAAAAFLASAVGLGTLFGGVYSGALRHEGLLYVLAVVLYWIVEPEGNRTIRFLHRMCAGVVLPFLMVQQVAVGVPRVVRDIRGEMSSSRAFGELVRSDPAYRDAVLVGEPDYLLDSMPYYVENPIWIPREGRYGRWVIFTTGSRAELSLADLLRSVPGDRPVLLALGHFGLEGDPAGIRRYPFGKAFTWTRDELAECRAVALPLARFRGACTDESYDVFLIPPAGASSPPPPRPPCPGLPLRLR